MALGAEMLRPIPLGLLFGAALHLEIRAIAISLCASQFETQGVLLFFETTEATPRQLGSFASSRAFPENT